MRIEDIERVILVSPLHEVWAHAAPPAEFPGYLRNIYIRPGPRVYVEFEVDGMDEGGAYFEGAYSTIADAVEALESFLSSPVAEWHDLNASVTPFTRADRSRLEEGHVNLAKAIVERTVPLPGGAKFVLIGSGSWKDIEDGVR